MTVQNASVCASIPEGWGSRATVADASNPTVKGDIRESKLQHSIWLRFLQTRVTDKVGPQYTDHLSLAGYLTMLYELQSFLSVEYGERCDQDEF